VGRDEILNLVDAFGIRAFREANVQVLPHAENVAAINRGRRLDVQQPAIGTKRPGDGVAFGPARRSRAAQDDGAFVQDQGGVFDEDGIWKIGLLGEGMHAHAKRLQCRFVLDVLQTRAIDIDFGANQERQLTFADRPTYLAGNRDYHVRLFQTAIRRQPGIQTW
jgi:hypothetical protein